MQLIPSFLRARLRALARDERGFTMFALLSAMMAVMGLSVAAFAAADGDQMGARRDQDHKRAYSAAEAGINEYLAHLNSDSEYFKQCNTRPWINQPWDGTGPDPRRRRNLRGADVQYTIELLPPVDPATGARFPACDPANASSTIDTSTGTVTIRATGFARGTRRSLIGTFRRRGFLDYIYFTDLETANPVTYRVKTGAQPTTPDVQTWAAENCSSQHWMPTGWGSATYTGTVNDPAGAQDVSFGCTAINFVSGDVIRGPLHTNDEMLICGTPVFGRSAQDPIEATSPNGWRGNGSSCGADTPQFTGTTEWGAARLAPPPSNGELQQIADPGYVFSGKTSIEVFASSIQVTNKGTTRTLPYPPKGVVFVANDPLLTCSLYDPTDTDQLADGCGTALVKGTYGRDLTIGAASDIVVEDNLRNGNDSMLGLIANNFVRVAHPVDNRSATGGGAGYDWTCDNRIPGERPLEIDAAILALGYSFIVDNWYCGADLGTLSVTGAIAQKYRGIVGTFGGDRTGYMKDYVYDDRLRYRQPPHFLDPVQSAWRVTRQTEQLRAR